MRMTQGKLSDAKLTTAIVARRLDVTPAAVRAMVRQGRLAAAETTVSGIRLFDGAAVERFAEEREAAARAKAAARDARAKAAAAARGQKGGQAAR